MSIKQGFILGAGLGTRLRPMTLRVPKPLVPLFHRPLAEWILQACERAGVERFAVNTHHLPQAWRNFAAGKDITFFDEPVLLETGGGLKNIQAWIGDEPLLVHNGDIFSTMPLEKLMSAHEASGMPVTLALRSSGPSQHVATNATGERVTDIRNILGRGEGTHLFTGIYCVSPEFLRLIPSDEKISVIPAFLELIKQTQLGAVVMDEGEWLDLGDRESYFAAHRELGLAPPVHAEARIQEGVVIESSVIGPRAFIGRNATVRNSIIWPDACVGENAVLEDCIVYSQSPITGYHVGVDW